MGDHPSALPLSAQHLQRLGFVRYLLNVGIEQSRRPEPFAAAALLTFHDAVEMYLQIVSEHFGVGQNRPPDFLEYWKLLEEKGVKLPYREVMRRFNSARVNLKHRGVRPAHVEIDGFRSNAIEFLSATSTEMLGVELATLSLTSLIKSEKVQTHLVKAEAGLASREWGTALAEAKLAFKHAMNGYAARSRAGSQSWRGFNLSEAFNPFFVERDLENALGRTGRDLLGAIGRMANAFEEAITVVGYNLDFEGYLLFKTHTPVIHSMLGGDDVVEWMQTPIDDPELVSRCVNFAIDTAIRLEAN